MLVGGYTTTTIPLSPSEIHPLDLLLSCFWFNTSAQSQLMADVVVGVAWCPTTRNCSHWCISGGCAVTGMHALMQDCDVLV